MQPALPRELRVERDRPARCPGAPRRDDRRRRRGPRRPRRRVDPRRADEHRADGRARDPGIRRSASNERIWRPKALRRHSMSSTPRCLRSSMIMPAQVPNTGAPERANSRSGSASPSRSIPSVIVVDSPPGIIARRARRGRRARAPRARRRRGRAASAVGLEVALEREDADEQLPASVGAAAEPRRACASRATSSPCRGPRRRGRPAPGRRSGWSPRRSRRRASAGSSDLKMPEPTNTPSAPSCIISAASAGVAMPPAQNSTTGSLPSRATWRTRSSGAWCSLAAVAELGVVHHGQRA